MSNIVNLYKQVDPKCAGCLKLTPMECADYLLWAWQNDKPVGFDFAMHDDDPHYLSNWWGVKIAYVFDFTAILCGHYGAFGNDFVTETMNNLMDEHRYDEDVCECRTHHSRQVLVLSKFIDKVNKDYDGNPDYLFCEISDDMREWLTTVKEKELVTIDPPETGHTKPE